MFRGRFKETITHKRERDLKNPLERDENLCQVTFYVRSVWVDVSEPGNYVEGTLYC